MKKNVLTAVITTIIVIGIIAVLFFMKNKSKVVMYTDPSTRGNTSGNLLNGGLFAYSEGKIYFANPYDDNGLYVMNKDLSSPKKLSSDKVSYLNVAGKYIFYTRRNDKKSSAGEGLLNLSTTGLFRIQTDGKNMGKLYDDPTMAVCLYGNNVFYQHYDREEGLQLHSVKINGKDDTLLTKEGIMPLDIQNDYIYYSGYDKEHNLHSMLVNGTGQKTILEGNFYAVTGQSDMLYFMDMQKDYTLDTCSINGENLKTLVYEHLATYNVDEESKIVYYQVDDGENNGLYEMDIQSGEKTLIQRGDYNYLHIVGDYLMFETYDGSELFCYDRNRGSVKKVNVKNK